MKTEFLKQFISDTDKLSVQSVRNEVIKSVKMKKEKEIMLPASKAGFQRKEIYIMNNLCV